LAWLSASSCLALRLFLPGFATILAFLCDYFCLRAFASMPACLCEYACLLPAFATIHSCLSVRLFLPVCATIPASLYDYSCLLLRLLVFLHACFCDTSCLPLQFVLPAFPPFLVW
jgi:hypothetical protein